MKIYKDVAYSSIDEKCKLSLYLPEGKNFPVIVYFHGGGLQEGDKDNREYAEMAERFTQNGYGFISCNYRLYPTAKFPEYLIDAANAVAFVKQHVTEYGGNGELYISGQSAGAWLSLMLCFNRDYLSGAGVDGDEIKGWIIDSAQCTSHFNVLTFERGLHPLTQRIDELAPLYFVNENTKFSKMLLIFYENDMPCRAEQNLLLYKNILCYNKEAKISYKQLAGWHCQGSCTKGEDGEYAFATTALDWLSKA